MKKLTLILAALYFIISCASKVVAANNTKIVVDDLGLKVEIPATPQRIIIADLPPLVHAYYVANDGVDGLIGAPKNNALVDTILPIVYPKVNELATGFRKNGELNIEELISLHPDLILYRSDNPKTGKMIRNTGIPAVAFQTYNMHGGNTVAAVTSWLEILGQILDKEEKTKELIANSYESIGILQSRMWNIKEEDKVSMVYFTGASLQEDMLTIAGDGLFGRFWAEISEANDVASKDIKGFKSISLEQLYDYNPEVIFLRYSETTSTPDDFYNDPLLADISAVKNKRVYKAPMGMFSWFGPSTDVPLSFLWHAKMLYPEQFADLNVVEETKTYYETYYGYKLSDEDIKFLFSNSLEAAK